MKHDNIVPLQPGSDSNANFDTMIGEIVSGFLQVKAANGPAAGDFFVMVIYGRDERITYWGLLDLSEMCEEDIYTEMAQRFRAGRDAIGVGAVRGYGILDIGTVLYRHVKAPPHLGDPPQPLT